MRVRPPVPHNSRIIARTSTGRGGHSRPVCSSSSSSVATPVLFENDEAQQVYYECGAALLARLLPALRLHLHARTRGRPAALSPFFWPTVSPASPSLFIIGHVAAFLPLRYRIHRAGPPAPFTGRRSFSPGPASVSLSDVMPVTGGCYVCA